jgi:protein-S-isoprenylcysteine O-methyltransferase Ste14
MAGVQRNTDVQRTEGARRIKGGTVRPEQVVATIFLPLTVITGFFGMNFGAITNNLQTNWSFIVLGLLLPSASVVASFLLYRRLARRFRVGTLAQVEA